MSKNVLYVLIVVIAITGSVAAVVLTKNTASPTSSSTASGTKATSTKTARAVDACNLFTLAEAKQILGISTITAKSAANGESSTSDVSVSMCTYNNSDTSTTATVLVRTGLTATGDSSNTAGYNQTVTTYKGAAVTGVGDKAYYNTDMGQLSVLKGRYWILVTSGGLQPADHSQSQETQIAQAIVDNL